MSPDPIPQPASKTKPRVEAVNRALCLLEAFADGTPRLTLTALAERTQLYPSTVLRLYNSLSGFGFLQRDSDGFFRLGSSLWRLGLLYRNSFELERHVRPVLQHLVDTIGETAAFYIKEGDRRICLYRAYANNSIGHRVEEGTQLPLDAGASSHVLLAFSGADGDMYEIIRRKRYCISLGEREPESNAVAVPVFDYQDTLVGALGIIGPSSRFSDDRAKACTDGLTAVSRRLSRDAYG